MALTYYYDNEDNIKLLNILKYGLMLLGLGLVFCSTSMTEASALACVLLLASIPASVIWEKRYAKMSIVPCWRCDLGLGIAMSRSPQCAVLVLVVHPVKMDLNCGYTRPCTTEALLPCFPLFAPLEQL